MPPRATGHQDNHILRWSTPVISRIALLLGVLAVLSTLPATTAQSRTYRFHVSCESKELVVEWGIGEIDPGREYLRTITGTKYPGCSISNYNPRTDADLPRERHKDAGGVIQGLPGVGIICGIFGC